MKSMIISLGHVFRQFLKLGKVYMKLTMLCVSLCAISSANAHKIWVVNETDKAIDVTYGWDKKIWFVPRKSDTVFKQIHADPYQITDGQDIGTHAISIGSVYDAKKRGQTSDDGWPLDELAPCHSETRSGDHTVIFSGINACEVKQGSPYTLGLKKNK